MDHKLCICNLHVHCLGECDVKKSELNQMSWRKHRPHSFLIFATECFWLPHPETTYIYVMHLCCIAAV